MFGTHKFEGVKLTADAISYRRESAPLVGVTATVEAVTHDKGRAGVGRAVLTGGIGVLARKRYVQQTYLTIAGPTFHWQLEVDSKQNKDARAFAAKVNDAARKTTGVQHGWQA